MFLFGTLMFLLFKVVYVSVLCDILDNENMNYRLFFKGNCHFALEKRCCDKEHHLAFPLC